MAELELYLLRNKIINHTNSVVNQFHEIQTRFLENEEPTSKVTKLLTALDNILSSFYSNFQKVGDNSIEKVPNDVLCLIFSQASIPDVVSLQLVCRRFNQILKQEEIWKTLSLVWWNKRLVKIGKPIFSSMEELIRRNMELNPTKGWKWLALSCRKEELKDGIGWKYTTETESNFECIEFGEFIKGELHGWGIRIEWVYTGCLEVFGSFEEDVLRKGILQGRTKRRSAKHHYRYQGTLNSDGEFNGIGTYHHLDGNWKYQRNYNMV
jgi:hypothetical protein